MPWQVFVAAFVDNSVGWRIQPAAADELFLDYRDFDNVRDNLVTPQLRAALNEVAEKLRTKVGGQIEIINVIVPLVNYDQATQDRINALTNDHNVLVSKCLDAAREAHLSPPGCWPNTTAVPTVHSR